MRGGIEWRAGNHTSLDFQCQFGEDIVLLVAVRDKGQMGCFLICDYGISMESARRFGDRL